MGHEHHHHHHTSTNMSGRGLFYSLLLNVSITVAQFIGGLWSGSLALLSDALHNFSDVLTLIISYVANKYTKREADFSKTFGYKRAEIIAAFVNAGTLIVVAVYLIIESVSRFFLPPESIESSIVIWLALIAIIGNGISALLLQKGSANNMNIRSSYIHLLTDMFTSVAVLVGGVVMKYFQVYWVDSVLTLCIGGYLIYAGIDLLKSSFKVLMLFSPDDISIQKIVENVKSIEGVKNMHHVHIWLLNEDEIHLEAHLEMEKDVKVSEFDMILIKIEAVLEQDFGINHFNIQPELNKCDNKSIIVQD